MRLLLHRRTGVVRCWRLPGSEETAGKAQQQGQVASLTRPLVCTCPACSRACWPSRLARAPGAWQSTCDDDVNATTCSAQFAAQVQQPGRGRGASGQQLTPQASKTVGHVQLIRGLTGRGSRGTRAGRRAALARSLAQVLQVPQQRHRLPGELHSGLTTAAAPGSLPARQRGAGQAAASQLMCQRGPPAVPQGLH